MTPTSSPAQQLLGKELDGGWKVTEHIERSSTATGSCFSQGYIVESADGQQAFLKALDFSAAFASPDPAKSLQAMTSAFNYERDLCSKCRNRKLTRVVAPLSEGRILVAPDNQESVVQYLVFELARGDVRSHLDSLEQFDTAWVLRVLHHIATGLQQLHGIGIAHQDLKPSNVLVFSAKMAKLADLGRSAYKGEKAPYDDHPWAGDPTYAPPELLYLHLDEDWSRRRFGCDAYLLGSMVVFFFTRAAMTALLLEQMDESHHPTEWPGSFPEVLPYLRHAFVEAFPLLESGLPAGLREPLMTAVRQLCEPDPLHRGNPANRIGYRDPFSLERYVSQFDLLAKKFEIGLLGR